MSLLFVVPDRTGQGPSGGDRYDEAVTAAWHAAGHAVEVTAVPGSWPWPDERDKAGLRRVLQGDGPVLLDGLVAGAAPEAVEEAAARRPVAVLVHSPLSDGAGASGADADALDRAEGRALAAAHRVVATGRGAAEELARRHGLEGVAVVLPGAERAQLAAGGGALPHLLSLGAVTPVKNHGVLLRALADLVDRPWVLSVAGPALDRQYLRTLQHDADYLGLTGRITWHGPLGREELDLLWAQTDLLVHVSRYESFGMAVAEAHAHGIPTVVGACTGAVEALQGRGHDEPPGVAVPVDRPEELTRVLREWLTDARLRSHWGDAAVRRRNHLRTWPEVARELWRLLPSGAGGDE